MFSIPVTIPYHTPEGTYPLDATVPIDELVLVRPLDKLHSSGIEFDTLYSCIPSCELLFDDGRKLPVLETSAVINRYLDAYRQIETFYTAPATPARKPIEPIHERDGSLRQAGRGVVVPLFGHSPPCASLEAPTPD